MLAALGGELIELLLAMDRWVLSVTAWLSDPCAVPKKLKVTLPTPPPTQRPLVGEPLLVLFLAIPL